MKYIGVLVILLSYNFALAGELNKSPSMPPSTLEFEAQMKNHLDFIRTCAYLYLTKRDPNPDNCDRSLQKAMMLLYTELNNLKFAFSSQIQNPPFFKYGESGFMKATTAEKFKEAWRNYFFTVCNQGSEIIKATAGLKRTRALELLEHAYFIMTYQATAQYAHVKVHVQQPRWIESVRPYPKVNTLIDLYELANVYSSLNHLNIHSSAYDEIQNAEIESMTSFLRASNNKGVQNLRPQNFWQFLMLREFWQDKVIPAAENEVISDIDSWKKTVAYRVRRGVPGCDQLLKTLEEEQHGAKGMEAVKNGLRSLGLDEDP